MWNPIGGEGGIFDHKPEHTHCSDHENTSNLLTVVVFVHQLKYPVADAFHGFCDARIVWLLDLVDDLKDGDVKQAVPPSLC